MTTGRTHIAVIDDNPDMRSLLTDFLGAHEFTVSTFASPDEAQARLEGPLQQSDPIHLIVSDNMMPRMTGLQFLDWLQHANPTIPVILITAFGHEKQAADAVRMGAVDYLTKPFEVSKLIEAIRHHLGRPMPSEGKKADFNRKEGKYASGTRK